MNIVGIIAEYNPFHHGHHYQIQQTRERLNPDVLVVLMSGNVVQRGEFAIMDKWNRASIATQLGADIVIEMPLFATLQSADYFAKYCVEIMSQLGCCTLVFGTETASAVELENHVKWLNEYDVPLQEKIKYFLEQGNSYPLAVQQAVEQLLPSTTFELSSPNHLLAIQYVKANQTLQTPMHIYPIKRLTNVLSGTEIRKYKRRDTLQTEAVPKQTNDALTQYPLITWENYWELLKYKIMSTTPLQLRHIIGVTEGIEHLLKKIIGEVSYFEELMAHLVTKRRTRARVQRMLMAILLNITQEEWQNTQTLRVLSSTEKGRHYLRRVITPLHLVTNMKQSDYQMYTLNLKADNIYQMGNSAINEQNKKKYTVFN